MPDFTYLSVKFLAMVACLAGGCRADDRPATAEGAPVRACSRRLGVPNHVPEYLCGRAKGDPIPSETQLELRVALKLRNEAALDAHLAAGGPPMSQEAFAAAHLPTEADVAEATAALAAHGLAVDPARSGTLLHVRGTAQAAAKAFGTPIVAGAERDTFRPKGDVRLPHAQIAAVVGLAKSQPVRGHGGEAAASRGGFTPAEIRSGYGLPAGMTGAGQHLAVVELDGYDPADIAAYCRRHGLREVPRRDIRLGGYDGRVITPAGQSEATLDIELINALVPDAAALWVVAADPAGPSPLTDTLSRLANPEGDEPLVPHISCSWGRAETGMSQAGITALDAVLKQLAAVGSTVWAATGDNGASDDLRVLSVDSPASSSYAIAVGGTTLTLGSRGEWAQEATWAGSGGGLSCFWPTPSWQAKIVSQGETRGMRAIPDVAMHADPAPGYAVVIAGREATVGGTSCAAPLFAAVAAMAEAARSSAGLAPMGFAAPRLYSIAATPATRGAFHDIISGCNNGAAPGASDPRNPGFWALPGYDRATGWGSPVGEQLLPALTARP